MGESRMDSTDTHSRNPGGEILREYQPSEPDMSGLPLSDRAFAGKGLSMWHQEAERAREDYGAYGRDYGDCAHKEAELEAHRHVLLASIKYRYMDGTKGALAATPAEHAAKIDPEYLSHLELQRDTVRRKDDASVARESARMRFEIAREVMHALGA